VSRRTTSAVWVSDPAPYRAAFRCPVSFGAPRNSLLFAGADMVAPLPTSNPLLAELHERFAGEYLRHFDHAQTSYRAREVIIRRLPDGEPRRDQVACELCMSERTLQRRLEPPSSSCWMTRAASSPSTTSAGCTSRLPGRPTCSASPTRAASSAPAGAGSTSRPGNSAGNCWGTPLVLPARRRRVSLG
jgi:hypothetical protein